MYPVVCVGYLEVDPRVVSLRRFPASIDISVEAEAVFLSELEKALSERKRRYLESYMRYLSFLSLRGSQR